MMTWKESDDRMPRLINQYLKNMATSQNPHYMTKINAARQVLPMTKPFVVRDYTYARHSSSSQYDIKTKIGYDWEVFRSKIIPEELMVFKSRKSYIVGGLKFPFIHSSIIQKGSINEMMMNVADRFKMKNFAHSPQFRQSVLEAGKNYPEIIMHLSWFKNSELLLPLTQDMIMELIEENHHWISPLLNESKPTLEIRTFIYSKRAENEHFIPSDIGIPILTGLTESSFQYFDANSTQAKNERNSTFHIKSVTVKDSSIRVLVPWVNKTLSVKIDREMALDLSLKIITIKTRSNTVEWKFDILQQPDKTMPLISFSQQPYSMVMPIAGAQKYHPRTIIIPLTYRHDGLIKTVVSLIPNLGVDLSIERDSSLLQDFTYVDILKLSPARAARMTLLPTLKPFQIMVTMPKQSSLPLMEGDIKLVDEDKKKSVAVSIGWDHKLHIKANASLAWGLGMESAKRKHAALCLSFWRTYYPDSDSLVAIESSINYPVISKSIRDIVSSPQETTMNTKIISIFNNGGLRKVVNEIVVKSTVDLSPEVRRAVSKRQTELMYDRLNIDVIETIPFYINKFWSPHKVVKSINRMFYPEWKETSTSSPKELARLEGTRPIYSNEFFLRMQSKGESGVTKVNIPEIFKAISPLSYPQ